MQAQAPVDIITGHIIGAAIEVHRIKGLELDAKYRIDLLVEDVVVVEVKGRDNKPGGNRGWLVVTPLFYPCRAQRGSPRGLFVLRFSFLFVDKNQRVFTTSVSGKSSGRTRTTLPSSKNTNSSRMPFDVE